MTLEKQSEAEQEKEIVPQKEAEETPSAPGEFPMTVHLKGFEDYFEDFSWDAKKVMEVLGIKRSRLNQISGEELRVGKARVDRYLRPIYRPEDVKEYLKWTKPTASHKRSTSIIDEAREKLDKTSGDLKESLITSQETLKKDLSKIMNFATTGITKNSEQIQFHLFKKVQKLFQRLSEYTKYESSFLSKQSLETAENLSELSAKQEPILEAMNTLKSGQNELLQTVGSLEKSLSLMTEKLSYMEKEQKDLKESLKKLEAKNKDKNQNLSAQERKKTSFFHLKIQKKSVIKPKKSLSTSDRKKISYF